MFRRQTWPYFNASVAQGRINHVLVILEDRGSTDLIRHAVSLVIKHVRQPHPVGSES
jgi:hypothetical protein